MTVQLNHPSRISSSSTPRERHRLVGRAARSAGRFRLDALESRTLMSATFGTVDNFQLAAGQSSDGYNVAADSAGNIYAAGIGHDSAGASDFVVREKASGTTTWTNLLVTPTADNHFALTVDATGAVYAASSGTIWKRLAGQSFSVIAQYSVAPASNNYSINSLTTDAAGDVFAAGVHYAYSGGAGVAHWDVRKQTAGTGAFLPVDDYAGLSGAGTQSISVVGGTGPSAGIYVVGSFHYAPTSSTQYNDWAVRKSSDGGAIWSTVDEFRADTIGTDSSTAYSLTTDAAGNVFVAGQAQVSTITGYTKVKGQQQPVYNITTHWIVRKSASGAAGSWSVNDDYQLSSVGAYGIAHAATTDLAGNIYVGGEAKDAGGILHAIIRTNASGTWQTVDDYQLAAGKNAVGWFGLAVDPSTGFLYAAGLASDTAGLNHWLIRAAAGPAALVPAISLVQTASLQPAATAQLAPAAEASITSPTLSLITASATPPAATQVHATPTATLARALANTPANLHLIALDNLLNGILY